MPNKLAHGLVNTVIGLLSGMVLFGDYLNVLIFTILCMVTSRLPDMIEKPRSKYHRGFFHSYPALIASLVIFAFLSASPLSGLIYGYSCHILLDKARTKSFRKFNLESRS